MKIYAGENNFLSIVSEERWKKMKEIIFLLKELGILRYEGCFLWLDWDTKYTLTETLEFLDKAKDISEDEVKVIRKFGIKGVDLYEKIGVSRKSQFIEDYDFGDFYCHVSDEDLEKLKPLYLDLFGEEEWEKLMEMKR